MKPKITTLKNGLKIMSVPMKDNPTVTVMVFVRTGTDNETKEINGISHFLEHMCFKGTKKRSSKEISRYLDSLGAESNAFTWYPMTAYYAKGATKHWKKFLDVVSDVYLNSTFPKEEIEKERGVIMGEIDMYTDIPMRVVSTLFSKALYGDQPAGWSVLGPKEVIKKFTQKDFIKYHTKQYVAENTLFVLAGDVSNKDVVKAVTSTFSLVSEQKAIKKKKVKLIKNGPMNLSVTKKTDQIHFILGGHSYSKNHKDSGATSLLLGILGKGMSSRLFVRLREEMGAGYYVHGEDVSFSDRGFFQIRAGVNPKLFFDSVDAVLRECARLSVEPVKEKELKKIKEYVLGELRRSFETSDDVAENFAFQELLTGKIKSLKEQESEIYRVTAKDITRVAKALFQDKNLFFSYIGPKQDSTKLRKVLTFYKK